MAFEQLGVEFPATWSLNATNILAQKYFRGTLGTPERESSLRQVDRPGGRHDHRAGASRDGYFVDDAEAEAFSAELKHLIVTQKAAFNSPGLVQHRRQGRARSRRRPASSSSVDDTMDSILNWYVEEGDDLQGRLGRRHQPVPHPLVGRAAQGRRHRLRPGQLHAGRRRLGRHHQVRRQDPPRRQDGHPRRRPSRHRGLHLVQGARGAQGPGARATPASTWTSTASDSHSIQYQNANNSVRVTDEFMQAVVDDGDWHLRAVTTGEVVQHGQGPRAVPPDRQAAWECADPGMQFDTTINRWHTAANTGRINGSNPCSEYMHLDNSACNLASLNLLKFLNDDEHASTSRASRHAVEVVFTAQEILVGNADYPTERHRRDVAPLPPARPRLRQPRRPADGAGPALRLRRRPGLGRGHHRAHDRPRLRHVGPHRRPHGPVRRLRRERASTCCGCSRMHRDAAAEIDEELVPPDLLVGRPGGVGRGRRARRAATACATARPRCWRPPAPSA